MKGEGRERAEKVVHVRVTAGEWEQWRGKAAVAGVTQLRVLERELGRLRRGRDAS